MTKNKPQGVERIIFGDVKSRIVEIPIGTIGVVFRDNKFFKPEHEKDALTSFYSSSGQTYIDIYTRLKNMNPEYFMRKAKIIFPTKHALRPFGCSLYLCDTHLHKVNPPSTTQISGGENPKNVMTDPVALFRITNPILNAIEYSGRDMESHEIIEDIKYNASLIVNAIYKQHIGAHPLNQISSTPIKKTILPTNLEELKNRIGVKLYFSEEASRILGEGIVHSSTLEKKLDPPLEDEEKIIDLNNAKQA